MIYSLYALQRISVMHRLPDRIPWGWCCQYYLMPFFLAAYIFLLVVVEAINHSRGVNHKNCLHQGVILAIRSRFSLAVKVHTIGFKSAECSLFMTHIPNTFFLTNTHSASNKLEYSKCVNFYWSYLVIIYNKVRKSTKVDILTGFFSYNGMCQFLGCSSQVCSHTTATWKNNFHQLSSHFTWTIKSSKPFHLCQKRIC